MHPGRVCSGRLSPRHSRQRRYCSTHSPIDVISICHQRERRTQLPYLALHRTLLAESRLSPVPSRGSGRATARRYGQAARRRTGTGSLVPSWSSGLLRFRSPPQICQLHSFSDTLGCCATGRGGCRETAPSPPPARLHSRRPPGPLGGRGTTWHALRATFEIDGPLHHRNYRAVNSCLQPQRFTASPANKEGDRHPFLSNGTYDSAFVKH